MLKSITYHINSPKIPKAFDGFRILHLSDLHSACFGKGNQKLLAAAGRARPDIIVMTGDMVNGSDKPFPGFLRLAGNLARKWPSYYVLGNHEQTLTDRLKEPLLSDVKKAGVRLLSNDYCALDRNGAQIRLYGMHFHMRYYRDFHHDYDRHAHFTAEDLKELVGPAPKDSYNILLTHNPLFFPSYAKWGADLTLSGHIHGGIIRLPVLGGLLSPECRFFPKYDGGLFADGGRCLEVSRGLGNNFAWRVNNPPELPLLVLHSKCSEN